MAKTLVLGANGFIGSHLVDSLVNAGHTVRAFDRFSDDSYRFEKNDKTEIFPGNFLNQNDLECALKDVDYVFHFISTTTPATSDNDPVVDIDTNIRASVELFKLCVEKKIKKVIFASTGGSIYGSADNSGPFKEIDPTLPVSPYAIGKLTIENYLRYFRVKYDLNSLVLRITNPYGERQPFNRKQGVIPIFIENICQGRPVVIFGDGSMTRDYIYVKDLTDRIASIFQNNTKYDTYNIGNGVATSINQLIDAAKIILKKDIIVEHKEAPSTFLHKVEIDTSRFNEEFGNIKNTSLEQGMMSTYKYIEQEIAKLKDEK